MIKTILVTGASGKQGDAVISALLEQDVEVNIISVHRNPQYPSAQSLARKSPSIRLLPGDLNDAPGIFAAAARAFPNNQIWGVYSVQSATAGPEELNQGKSLIDEALKNGVRHFVYSSVDRGGEEKSWTNPTPIAHCQTKHEIEHHLREAAGTQMGWTILRPVAFMENFSNGFGARVFLTALHNKLKERKLQWVSAKDVGHFAAQAFLYPEQWNHRAVSLAGDELNCDEMVAAFKSSGTPVPYTLSFLGSAMKLAVKEDRLMIEWFAKEGFAADIGQARSLNPHMLTFEDFLRSPRS